VSDGLRIGCNLIMFFIRKIDESGLEGGEDLLNQIELLVRGSMLNEDLERRREEGEKMEL